VLLELGVAAARAASGVPALPWRLARAGCAPPESADGREDDAAGDVYALCAVLFRAASAWLPEELPRGSAGAPPAEPELERDFLAVLLRGLADDPAERYPSALELARDLERVEQGQPPQASQPRPAEAQEGVKPASVVSTISGVFRKFLRRGE
jgi:serine/threonine-protein kinase